MDPLGGRLQPVEQYNTIWGIPVASLVRFLLPLGKREARAQTLRDITSSREVRDVGDDLRGAMASADDCMGMELREEAVRAATEFEEAETSAADDLDNQESAPLLYCPWNYQHRAKRSGHCSHENFLGMQPVAFTTR